MPYDQFKFGRVDADTRTLRAAMTVPPPPGRLWRIDQTIRQLRQHGIWQKLDVLWIPAAHDAQAARLNWKAPASFPLTTVNSPTFTADRGYAGNGTTSYLDTGWTPSSNGVQYTQDSASLGCYVNAGTDTADNTQTQFGAVGSVSARNGFVFARAAGGVSIQINGGTSHAVAAATRRGMTAANRADSANVESFRNGASLGTAAKTSTGTPDRAFYIGCYNNNGTAANFCNNRIALAFAGASLNSAQYAAFYSITQSHLSSIGAAV